MSHSKRVSEIVEINEWNKGDLIVIQAGTGAGKSYLIKNKLYDKAKSEGKRILYLVNRTRLLKQFEHELIEQSKLDVIDLMLYQQIEKRLLHQKLDSSFLMKYDYIVCDEFHYFFTDASFNITTDLSIEAILKASHATRILTSATCEYIVSYLKDYRNFEIKSYDIPSNSDHIEQLYFYYDDKVIEKFLSKLLPDEKVMYFCRSARKAHRLNQTYINSLFVCSENNQTYKGYVDADKVSSLLKNEMFEEQILFTTQTLDNGINIKDTKVKYIIADIDDIDVLIQCLGRKRILNKHDTVTIIIKAYDNKTIAGRRDSKKKQLKKAEYLKSGHSIEEFIKKYPREHYGNMIYDIPVAEDSNVSTKKVNHMMYYKYTTDIKNFEQVVKSDEGYINYVKDRIKMEDHKILDKELNKIELADKLELFIGIEMYAEEQKKFRDAIKDHISCRGDGLRVINTYFDENKIKYKLETERQTKGENRNKRYWTLHRVV